MGAGVLARRRRMVSIPQITQRLVRTSMDQYPLKLHIGSKRYSSWSLRPWIVLKYFQIPFEEEIIHFHNEPDRREFSEETKAAIRCVSASGRVPSLQLGAAPTYIHDSLAICETLNEIHDAKLWPSDFVERASARAIANELHCHLTELRKRMPICCGVYASWKPKRLEGELDVDVDRLEKIIEHSAASDTGSFLFGSFSIADAMMIPYMLRLHYYRYPTTHTVKSYTDHILSKTPVAEWMDAGAAENPIIPDIEALAANFPDTAQRALKL